MQPSYSLSPGKPKLALPPGSCDAHVHVFGPRERFPWGTDWPHPNLAAVPDDGVLVDLLSEIAPSETQRQALLVDNPRRFYGFSK